MHQTLAARLFIVKKLIHKYDSIDDFFHFYIHSSGLFYGYATHHLLSNFKSEKTWSHADHYKVSMTEGLFAAYFFAHKEKIIKKENIPGLIQEAQEKIYEFYVLYTIEEGYFKKRKSFLLFHTHNKHNIFEKLEKIIDYRINNFSMLTKGFWKGSQFNIFSYIDILYFIHWLQGDYLYDKRSEIKKSILKTMIATSNTNPEQLERQIIHYYITSGNLPKNIAAELQKDIAHHITLEDICNQSNHPHIIKRLMIEHAIIVLLSNQTEEDSKNNYLQKLSELCHISEDELQYSNLLIENFISHNKEHILYIRHKFKLNYITRNFTSRFYTFFIKNKSKIITELSQNKELLELLWKAKNEKLSDEEREKVKSQIIDILKTIPSLTIFMIPGGSVILPLLLKIIPEEILIPSSFRNK
jgi:hypothetical protein